MTQSQIDYVIEHHKEQDIQTMCQVLKVPYNNVYGYCDRHNLDAKRSVKAKRVKVMIPIIQPKEGFFNIYEFDDWVTGGKKLLKHR